MAPPVWNSGGACELSSPPKYCVEFEDAGHFAWTDLNQAYVSSIDAYSVAFFDASLKGRKEALNRLLDYGRPKDVSELRSAE